MKQTPHQWIETIDIFLVDKLKFEKCQNDPCNYVKHELASNLVTIVAMYVDDLSIAESNVESISLLKCQLNNKFEMKDLGKQKFLPTLKSTGTKNDKFLLCCKKSMQFSH